VLELFPQLERLKVLRSWTGLCDLSPDYSPILGQTELEHFHVSAGWGTYGFKAAPIVGTTLAGVPQASSPTAFTTGNTAANGTTFTSNVIYFTH